MRLAIAEDSGLFRSSLTLLLETSGAEVTASEASGAELLTAIRTDLPDAVILDIRMPPSFTDEGISTAAELRHLYPHVGILVLSTYAETSYASQLLETVLTGVGYLLKDNVTDAGTLMDSLARVADGETVDRSDHRPALAQQEPEAEQDRHAERARATRSFATWPRADPTSGIAKVLFLSPRTVETHVTSIFLKLELDQADTDNNRIRAVLAFLRSADAGKLRSPSRDHKGPVESLLPPGAASPSGPGHLRMITSLCPNAAARSSPSRRAVKAAMTSPWASIVSPPAGR